jgi:hypothetical protein
MLKYGDLYRYSDGVALIGHRHDRPGADNSALAPRMRAFPNVAGTRQDQPSMGAKAHVHTGLLDDSFTTGLNSL